MTETRDTRDQAEIRIDRRGVLAGAAGALALAAAGGATAAEEAAHPAGHAGHGGKYATLAHAARVCIERGETCVAHCLSEFRSGGNTLALCATRVEEMLAACRGLAVLASLESQHLAAYAASCAEICRSCETECRKHEKMHEICRACAESCADCIKACEALKSA